MTVKSVKSQMLEELDVGGLRHTELSTPFKPNDSRWWSVHNKVTQLYARLNTFGQQTVVTTFYPDWKYK